MAGVSAISFVAFKHPNGYAKLFPFLLVGVSAVFVGAMIWQVSIDALWDRLNPHLATEFTADAVVAKNALSLPYLWSAVAYIGIVAFLWVNLRLPPFLNRMDNEDAHGNGV